MGKLLLYVIHSSRERYTRGKFLALSTLSVFATTPRVKKLCYHETYFQFHFTGTGWRLLLRS